MQKHREGIHVARRQGQIRLLIVLGLALAALALSAAGCGQGNYFGHKSVEELGRQVPKFPEVERNSWAMLKKDIQMYREEEKATAGRLKDQIIDFQAHLKEEPDAFKDVIGRAIENQ